MSNKRFHSNTEVNDFLCRNAKPVRYSLQNFDNAQALGMLLTRIDRESGVPGMPEFGYTTDNFKLAERLLKIAVDSYIG